MIASGALPPVAGNVGIGSTPEQAFITEGERANVNARHSADKLSYIELPIAETPNLRTLREN